MTSENTPPITLAVYERIFRTLHAAVMLDGRDPAKSCVFFAIAGAYILDHQHGRDAKPQAGLAGYNPGLPTMINLIFGEAADGKLIAHDKAFHCWVECNGWVIDFAAPLFDLMVPPAIKGDAKIPARMFQKLASAGAPTTADLDKPGAFMHLPDGHLRSRLVKKFINRPANIDLVKACEQRYAGTAEGTESSMLMCDQDGDPAEVSLSSVRIDGAW